MAIRATIKSHRRDDGFDIDIVAELLLHGALTPAQVLDLLYEAINGPSGSMYHGMVERQTRCVTVRYADGMHLDITLRLASMVEDVALPDDAEPGPVFRA